MQWETVIGLEVHTQLKTKSKIFSGSATNFGSEPNTQASLIDLGMPGVLPVLNEEAIKMAVKFGLAIEAQLGMTSVFDRKNYFYPDLPKGYQISQFGLPIVGRGHLSIRLTDGKEKTIGITRAHLEEDAGKSLHEDFAGMTGIDLNRAGIPLLEIVSEPDLRSSQEAVSYLKTLHALVTYLDICDGNMQEGSFRCDANVSIRQQGTNELGIRAEVKNINSFRFVERAINYEIQRQIDILENGGKLTQETRLYDADKNETRAMRSKEEANDYRYFPDPDLLPIILDNHLIESVRQQLPELPWQKQQRFIEQYELNRDDAQLLISDRNLAHYFEEVVSGTQASAKMVANWISGELLAILNKDNLTLAQCPITATQLSNLLTRIHDQTISGKIAKTVFIELWQQGGNVDAIINSKGLKQVTDTGAIEAIVDQVIADNPKQLEQYRAGKDKLFGFFVGQVMKASKGKANPQLVNDLLEQRLS